ALPAAPGFLPARGRLRRGETRSRAPEHLAPGLEAVLCAHRRSPEHLGQTARVERRPHLGVVVEVDVGVSRLAAARAAPVDLPRIAGLAAGGPGLDPPRPPAKLPRIVAAS